ncbi:GNAT family N-acetyltransferase [Desertivirga arenae]|uniref:GNAT family N-acetyltransferase n=1 Tax=Desertivirga arenae TaxID=2810309 RepID=UPI001A976971|nr:GNAT family N-acetyltransferase [Pedobacter sp. SYSU D00823]
MNIRTARLEDLDTVNKLAEEIWNQAYKGILSNEQIDFMLADIYSIASLKQQIQAGAIFILAEENEESVGFASFTPNLPAYKVHKLYILSSQQGKGVGSKLLSFIENEAKGAKASFLDLNVNRNNPALNFYTRIGFEILEEVDIPYHHFVLNDYVMRKTLVEN